MVDSLKRGLMTGLKTTWMLSKVIFPITLIVTVLQFTPVLGWITRLIEPVMGLFGLSGDAAIPLVLGSFLNLYAGIAGILSVDLTVKEVFMLAVMLSFAHNLLIESGVAARVGIKVWQIIAVRLGLSFFSAIAINLFWNGGQEKAVYGFAPPTPAQPDGWFEIIFIALQKASFGVLQMALIIIPLMAVIQVMKDRNWLTKFSKWMAPFTRFLGMKDNTSFTLAAGLLFGLAYGAGVMIQAVEEDGVSKKDVTLAFIFLVACHAVVEDTLVFVPLGIPVLPLLLARVGFAVGLTWLVARIWTHYEQRGLKEKEVA